MASRVLRLFHTLRYLRPSQFYGRLWIRLYRPRPDRRAAPGQRTPRGKWHALGERPPTMLDAGTFRFLGITGQLRTASDWDDPRRLRLWRYNLHYFDDLNAQGSAIRESWHRVMMARWLRENPPAGGTGWEPYPTSLRIVNWIKWSLSLHRGRRPPLEGAAIDSLATQVRWLRQRLEIHLLGNHLLANAKALVFAGTFFIGPESDRWMDKGLAIIHRELDEQILPDGGHFERSPMYHAIMLDDVLDLLNLTVAFPDRFAPAFGARLRETAARMLRWLRVMTHPDGGIALFNDAALDNAPTWSVLSECARRLGVAVNVDRLDLVTALPESGYLRLENGRAVVICDVAPVGPDYLPGHAHADTLSFELSLDGRRLLVNGGTSTYEPGGDRQRQRATAAHNTVVVDHQDSSEVWGAFRVARRARPLGVRWGTSKGVCWAEGAHDGYQRLPGRVTHRRKWTLTSHDLTIEDRVVGRYQSATSELHLHPGASASPTDSGGTVIALSEGLTVEVSTEPSTACSVSSTHWNPVFGPATPNETISALIAAGSLTTRVKW